MMMRVNRSFSDLEGAVRAELLGRTLFDGLLLALGSLWAAGCALFLAVFSLPWLTVAWTLVVLAAGLAMVATSLRSTDMRALALQLALARAFGIKHLPVESRGRARANIEQFAAIRALIGSRNGSEEALFRRALQNLFDVLYIHIDALGDAFVSATRRSEIAGEARRVFASVQRILATGVERGTYRSQRLAAQLVEETDQALSRLVGSFAQGGSRDTPDGEKGEVQGLSERVIEDVPPELLDLREALETGFSRIPYAPGLEALRQLTSQYERLLVVLGRRRESDPFAMAQLPHLANEAYHQGLSVLQDALEIAEAVRPAEKVRLAREAQVLEQELAAMQGEDEAFGPRRLREERLQSHRERLRGIQEQEFHLEEFLHQCGRCEASLDRTRTEVASLKGESSELMVTAATDTLRRTVELARGVQSELKRLTPR